MEKKGRKEEAKGQRIGKEGRKRRMEEGRGEEGREARRERGRERGQKEEEEGGEKGGRKSRCIPSEEAAQRTVSSASGIRLV